MITKPLRLAVTATHAWAYGGIVVESAAFKVGDVRPPPSAGSHDGGSGVTLAADLSR